jgi:hypothetical protein
MTARGLLCLTTSNSAAYIMVTSRPYASITPTYYGHRVDGLFSTTWDAYTHAVTITAEYLRARIAEYQACYDIYFNDYYKQLVEQYDRAVEANTIPAEVWADLKNRYPTFFNPEYSDYSGDL